MDATSRSGCVLDLTSVADLGDEHRRQDRSDAVDGLDGFPARVAAQPTCDHLGEPVDLEVVQADQLAQTGDAGLVGRGQIQPVEQLGAGGSPRG
jgi:hypothetical protein